MTITSTCALNRPRRGPQEPNWRLCPRPTPPCFCEHLPGFGPRRYSGSPCPFSVPVLEAAISPRSLVLISENDVQKLRWGQEIHSWFPESPRLQTSADSGTHRLRGMCAHTCISFQIYLHVHIQNNQFTLILLVSIQYQGLILAFSFFFFFIMSLCKGEKFGFHYLQLISLFAQSKNTHKAASELLTHTLSEKLADYQEFQYFFTRPNNPWSKDLESRCCVQRLPGFNLHPFPKVGLLFIIHLKYSEVYYFYYFLL